jgi:NitT/TauT family transport system permease protein
LQTGKSALKRTMNKLTKYSPLVLTIILFHAAWFSLNYIFKVKNIFVPNLIDTYCCLYNLFTSRQIYFDLSASLSRILTGFILSFLIAYPLTLITVLNRKVKDGIFYVIEFFRYLPIPVFIPLTILWFGVGDLGKIIIIFLGTFAQMIPMFYDSAISYTSSYSAVEASLRWTKKDVLKNLVIPGSAPAIWDNSRICLGWAWTYLIIAELLGAENGLGYSIIRAQRYLATDKIFAYIIVIGLIGILSDRVMVFGRKKLFKWF